MKINRFIENLLELLLLCVAVYFITAHEGKGVSGDGSLGIFIMFLSYGILCFVNFVIQNILLFYSSKKGLYYFLTKIKLFAIQLIVMATFSAVTFREFSFFFYYYAIIFIPYLAIIVLLFLFDTFLLSKPYRAWISQKKNRIIQYIIISASLISVIVYVVIITGIFDKDKQEEKAWKSCYYDSTIESYDAYIQKYPNGKYKEEATKGITEITVKKLEEDLFNKALLLKTEASVNEYLAAFPLGKFKKPLEVMLNSERGKFVDNRDGKEYGWVKIGEQVWMSENLNYDIPSSRCYNDNPQNCEKYGRLYMWNEASLACPQGWILPDSSDWAALKKYIEWNTLLEDHYSEVSDFGYLLLRMQSNNDWTGFGGNNATGFSALAGGYMNSFSNNRFYSMGGVTLWWSSSETKKDEGVIIQGMGEFGLYLSSTDTKEDKGFYIRCIKTK